MKKSAYLRVYRLLDNPYALNKAYDTKAAFRHGRMSHPLEPYLENLTKHYESKEPERDFWHKLFLSPEHHPKALEDAKRLLDDHLRKLQKASVKESKKEGEKLAMGMFATPPKTTPNTMTSLPKPPAPPKPPEPPQLLAHQANDVNTSMSSTDRKLSVDKGLPTRDAPSRSTTAPST